MAKALSWTIVLASILTLSAIEGAAQLKPWTISIEAESGLFAPTRSFGKNSTGTDDPDLIVLQPSAKAQGVAIFGGGIRIQMPNPTMSLRLSGYRTANGTVEGRSPACDILTPERIEWEQLRCTRPFEEEYIVSELMARVQFKQITADQRLRPTVDFGLGLRRYEFGGLDCPITLLAKALFICENADALTAPQTQPFLLFGLGLEYQFDSFAIFGRVHDQVAPYGGNARGEEEGQNDLLVSLGFSISVR